MPIEGPVRPSYYFNYVQPAPNPSTTQAGKAGELITCPYTGRVWVARTQSAPYEWVQVLPFVREDGATPTVGTQVVNDSGNLKVQRAAGMTGGEFRAFNSAVIDPNGIRVPLEQNGAAFVDVNKRIRASTVNRIPLGGDITIAAADTITPFSGANFIAEETGIYRARFAALFTHSGGFTVSIGIRLWQTNDANSFVASTSGHSSGGNGWVSLYTEVEQSLNAGDQLRFAFQSTDAGVTVKALPQAAFPNGIGTPINLNTATFRSIERIG